MVDVTTATIDVGQIITYCLPYIFAGLGAIWSAVLLPVLKRYFEHLLKQDQWDNIERASKEAAGKIWAEAEPTIAHAQITGQDPKVAFAVQTTADVLASTMKNLGITPEKLQESIESKILAQLGTMQARTGPAPGILPVPVQPVNGVSF